MKTIRNISAVAIVLCLCMAASCNKYQKAGELAKDVAAGVLLAQQTEITLHRADKIDDETHQKIQQKFSALADAGMRLDQAINETHNAGSATQALSDSIAALNDLTTNGLSGIKDPQTQLEVKGVLLTVQITLNNISAFSK
jgi:hypothetical protein